MITRETVSTLVPALVVATVGGVLSWQYQSALRHDRVLVAHTWEVISATAELLGAATDAETGQRGYVITGDPTFLQPYDRARGTLPPVVARLRTLVADNPKQLERLDQLETLTAAKMRELATVIHTRQQLGFSASEAIIAGSAGKLTMDAARAVVAEMNQGEHELLEQRMSQVHARERWVAAVGLAATMLSLFTRGLLNAWFHWPDRSDRGR